MLCQRVDETISEIQPGRVPAFAEVMKGLASEMDLFRTEWLEDYARPTEKFVALTYRLEPDLAFEDDRDFQEIPNAD